MNFKILPITNSPPCVEISYNIILNHFKIENIQANCKVIINLKNKLQNDYK